MLNIIDTLTEKGVTLISHKENIDTDTPMGKLMLTVFAALSQLEREQLKQRQREGIEIAKAQGKYMGRKPIEIDWTRFGQLYGEWKSKSITGRDFMRRMGLSANTFYRRVREYESEHGIAEPTSAAPSDQRKRPLNYQRALIDYLPGNKASKGDSRLYITPVSSLAKDFIRALLTCCLVLDLRIA